MRLALALIAAALAPTLRAQAAPKVEVDVQLRRLRDCPANEPAAQAELFGERLTAARASLAAALQPVSLVGPDVRVALLEPGVAARARAVTDCGEHLQGLGVFSVPRRACVLTTANGADDEQLWRAANHALAQVLVRGLLPDADDAALGYGWLPTGLAHRCALLAGDRVDTFAVRGSVLAPVVFWGGDPWRAAGELLRRDQLPDLADLLRTASHDYDLGQHVLSFALVEWLLADLAPTTHDGDANRPGALASLVARAADGAPCATALPEVVGADLATITQRLHRHVRQRSGIDGPRRSTPTTHHRPHPHAAVFVYTREPIRPRHRKVVAAALRQRHAAHTSGWQRVDRKPRLAVGPVNRRAGFWHQDELVKNIPRTWPMVAVFEYTSAGRPQAQLDCFRRVRGRRGDDGWMLDPGVGFVAHHNAQFVTAHDDRLSYLAVPDTPTGSHVGGSEFVHRGRVRWADGTRAAIGVWTLLEAPKTRTTERWHAVQTPLVDWFVSDRSRSLGARELRAVADLERELSPWGTDRVFRFPEIPAGLLVAGGKP